MENAIAIQGLCKQYPAFQLDNVSFSVPSGSIVGFMGKNGAGKTTTLKVILNAVQKDSGEITILGYDHAREGATARAEVGVVYDECHFHDWLRADQVGNILKEVYPSWDEELYQSLLLRFGLAGHPGRKDIIKTYSRGMKMKLSLAAALAHRPKLLVLDEATSGLDPIVRDEILDMFLEFIGDDEHSILFSSHITTDVEKVADYVVFIHDGEIILQAEKDVLLADYGLVKGPESCLAHLEKEHVVGVRRGGFGAEAMVDNRQSLTPPEGAVLDRATLDDILLFMIKGEKL